MVESGTSCPSFMMRCSSAASGPPLSTSALSRSPVRGADKGVAHSVPGQHAHLPQGGLQ